MGQRVIDCQVRHEYVTGSGTVVGAAGSHDDVVLQLAFGPMWAGTTRSIVWTDALGNNPTKTILTTDLLEPDQTEVYLVPIPAEPKAVPGQMSMTIKGVVIEDGVETSATLTATAFFEVMESGWDPEAGESPPITPSLADQIQAQVDAIKDDIATIPGNVARAEAAAETAEGASALAVKAAGAASTSAVAAQSAQEAAEKARDEAQGIVGGDFATNARVDWVEEEVGRVAQSVTDLETQVEQDVGQAIQQVNQTISGLSSTVSGHETSINNVQEDVSSLKTEVQPVARGGTGATTAADARQNLGAAPAYTYGTTDLTAGSSALETGKLYFVYE